MSSDDEKFSSDFSDKGANTIISPTGRSLGLVSIKDTTLYSDANAKVVHVPEKYVILKISTAPSGYTLQKVYGHSYDSHAPGKIFLPQPAVVAQTYRAKLIMFDASKGEAGSLQYDINVTRDAWYYLGVDHADATWCRNIAFEPVDAKKNRYMTDDQHFPSAADPIVHGFYLMENESQRGKMPYHLQAEPVSQKNPYNVNDPIPFRKNESIASNVMFHIGGFYEASLKYGHARWLGGSEGCFAFIPKKSIRTNPEDAGKITMETAFLPTGHG